MIIYKATNTTNGNSYIGQTIRTLAQRKQSHYERGAYFYNALMKYDKDIFIWEILCECETRKELDEMEIHYIKKYDTFNNGYNLTIGGDDNPMNYQRYRDKISNAMKGKKRPDLSEKNRQSKGQSYKDRFGEDKAREIKEKMSKSRKGEGNGMYGRTFTKESINKMSSIKQKYTYSFTSPDGEEQTVKSLKVFCKEHGFPLSSIKWMIKNTKKYKGWSGSKSIMNNGIEMG